MTLKKFTSLLLIIVMLATMMIGCDHNSSDDSPNNGRVYQQYSNLSRIESFSNGLAAFVIFDNTESYHFGMSGAWSGDYYYGYIDIEGNVVIEPTYGCNPNNEIPQFGEKYVRVADLDENEYLIDKKGNIKFQVGQNDVTAIGNVSNGYFWVETENDELSGKTYTVRYYSENDLSVVATFHNVRATPEDMTFSSLTCRSTISSDGSGVVIRGNDFSYYSDEIEYFNISDYDSKFVPEINNWSVDLTKIGSFSDASNRYIHVSSADNTIGRVGTVILSNSSGTLFYAIVDSNGNVLMQPQKNIAFPVSNRGTALASEMQKYDFCKNLCPAKDVDSEMWGYIDSNGNWKIRPQYSVVTPFSSDGYAIVNDKIVIDTSGKVVLSPPGWSNEQITSLSGTYKYTGTASWDYYITFYEDGTVQFKEDLGSAGAYRKTGTYSIKGTSLNFSNIGSYESYPGIGGDGSYSFYKDGDNLIINGKEWAPSN